MIPFRCSRCSKITISFKGLHCSHCERDKYTRSEDAADFFQPILKPGIVGPGYYKSVAEGNNRKIVSDPMTKVPSIEANIQTADNDFNFPMQSFECGAHKCDTIDYSKQENTSWDICQDSTTKNNRLIDTLNKTQNDLHENSRDIYTPEMVGTFLQSSNGTPGSSQQRAHPHKLCSVNESENKKDSVEMIRRQEIMEPREHVNETCQPDFAGSILFQSDNLILSLSPNSSRIINEQEEGNVHAFFSPLYQKNINGKDSQENLVATKTASEKKAKTFLRRIAKTCRKCGKRFLKQSTLFAHIKNKCDPNPYKCDECDEKFDCEFDLLTHRMKHGKDFQENLVATKTAAVSKAKTSEEWFGRNCGKCGRKFFTQASFFAHIRSNCDPKPFKCDECNEKFLYASRLLTHQRKHKSKKCNQCGFFTYNPNSYTAHMKSHTKKRRLFED